MAIDVTTFHKINIVDTCSIWNILSSKRLFSAVVREKCVLSCTQFVLYECLYKERKVPTTSDDELKRRLCKARADGHFDKYNIAIEDLQNVEVIRNRMNLAKGEISSMVFAMKTSQAFLTDDQGARQLATILLSHKMIQTTPQLFGWLIFCGILTDSDRDQVISEHKAVDRPLAKYLNQAYYMAMEMRLVQGKT